MPTLTVVITGDAAGVKAAAAQTTGAMNEMAASTSEASATTATGWKAIGDEAEAGSAKVSASVKGMGSDLLGFAAVAGVALGAKGIFDQWQQFQKVAGQTQAVLRSTGDASGQTASGVASLGNQLAKVDGINHNVIQSAENVLLRFTAIKGDSFQRAAKDAVDLGAAMHVGPEAGATRLGRALQDPIKGLVLLTRSGVQFTAQQKDQIAAYEAVGDAADAQGVIFKKVEQVASGSAAAQATAADQAKRSMEGLGQSLGQTFQGTANGALGAVTRLADGLAGLPPGVQKTGVEVIAATLLWSKFGDAITGVASKIGGGIGALNPLQFTTSGRQQAAQAAADQAVTDAQTEQGAAQAALNKLQETGTASASALTEANIRLSESTLTLRNAEADAAIEFTEGTVATGAWASVQAAAATAASATASALGPLGIALAAVAVEAKLNDVEMNRAASAAQQFHGSARMMEDDLKILGNTGSIPPALATSIGNIGKDAATTHDPLIRVATDLKGVGRWLAGGEVGGGWLADLAGKGKAASSNLKEIDAGLTALEATDPSAATRAYTIALAENHKTLQQGITLFPGYHIAVQTVAADEAAAASGLSAAAIAANTAYAAWKNLIAGQLSLASSTQTTTQALAAYQNAVATAAGGGDVLAQNLANLSQQMADQKAVTQAQQTAAEGAHAYQQAVQGVSDALYQQSQAYQAVANAEHSEQEAEYTLAQAHAQEITDLGKIQGLTEAVAQARQDATRALVNERLSEQSDQLGVASAKFAYEDAAAAAAAGPSSTDLNPNAQAELTLAAQQALIAYHQAQEKATESAQDLNTANAQGVSNAPGVVAANQALAGGYAQIATDAHSVTEDTYGVQQAQLGVTTAMHGTQTAGQQVQAAYYGVSTAAQTLKSDTDAVTDAQQKQRQDAAIGYVQTVALEANAKTNSTSLKDALIGDLQATEKELDQLGIHGQAAYDWLNAALGLTPQLDKLLGITPNNTPTVPALTGLPAGSTVPTSTTAPPASPVTTTTQPPETPTGTLPNGGKSKGDTYVFHLTLPPGMTPQQVYNEHQYKALATRPAG